MCGDLNASWQVDCREQELSPLRSVDVNFPSLLCHLPPKVEPRILRFAQCAFHRNKRNSTFSHHTYASETLRDSSDEHEGKLRCNHHGFRSVRPQVRVGDYFEVHPFQFSSAITTNSFQRVWLMRGERGESVVTSVTLPTTTSPVSGVYLNSHQEGGHGRMATNTREPLRL